MYQIANYDELYRPKDTKGKDLVYATYVKVPAKPNGRGVRALLEKPKGLEVFGIWVLLLELATIQKPENRGKLFNHKDEPATDEEIAKDIGLSRKIKLVKYALTVLVDLVWVLSTDKVRSDCGVGTEQVRNKSSVEKSSVEKSSVEKSKYLDSVFLSDDEYKKLVDKLGEQQTKLWIEELDEGIGSKGYKYKSHYKTILVWHRRKFPPAPPKPTKEEIKLAEQKKFKIECDKLRLECTPYLREKSLEELKRMRSQPLWRGRTWLIDEFIKGKGQQ